MSMSTIITSKLSGEIEELLRSRNNFFFFILSFNLPFFGFSPLICSGIIVKKRTVEKTEAYREHFAKRLHSFIRSSFMLAEKFSCRSKCVILL